MLDCAAAESFLWPCRHGLPEAITMYQLLPGFRSDPACRTVHQLSNSLL
jgi:hypothetical protein